MTPIKPTNLSLDAQDLERLERIQNAVGPSSLERLKNAVGPSKAKPAWNRTDTVRQALIALDRGLDQYRQRCEGLIDTPPPEPDQVEVYKRVVLEMGYETVLREPAFGRTPGGSAEVEIDGFRYSIASDRKLYAFRDSVQDGVPYHEMFEVRQGGLRPRLRSGPPPRGQVWTDDARELFGTTDDTSESR